MAPRVDPALDTLIERARREQHIPGLVAHVVRHGRVVHSRGYGVSDLANPTPPSPETVFPVGSISKSFTAALVYRLADGRRLDVTRTVGSYLPDLPPWRDSVTIKHLLTHTAGLVDLYDVPGGEDARKAGRPTRELVALVAARPLQHPPGSRFVYTFSSYAVLGALIERVTGQSYAEALRTHVFAPLGMRRSEYCGGPDAVDHAAGYVWDAKADSIRAGDPAGLTGMYTAGGVCSTATDVVRFTDGLLSGRFLSSASRRDMLTPPPSTRAFGNGAGIFVGAQDGHPFVSHTGSLRAGFEAEYSVFPEDSLTVVLIANRYDPNLLAIRRRIVREVLRIATDTAADVPLPAGQVQAYVGRYPTGGTGRLIFVEREGQLFGMGTTLRYRGNHTFVPSDDPEVRVVFEVTDGRATAMTVSRDGMVGLAGRRAPP